MHVHTPSVNLTKILLKRLFPSKSVCCLHHCHKGANGAYYFSSVHCPVFFNSISYVHQTLCLKDITLKEQYQRLFIVGISTSDKTDGISLHRSSGSHDFYKQLYAALVS